MLATTLSVNQIAETKKVVGKDVRIKNEYSNDDELYHISSSNLKNINFS